MICASSGPSQMACNCLLIRKPPQTTTTNSMHPNALIMKVDQLIVQARQCMAAGGNCPNTFFEIITKSHKYCDFIVKNSENVFLSKKVRQS